MKTFLLIIIFYIQHILWNFQNQQVTHCEGGYHFNVTPKYLLSTFPEKEESVFTHKKTQNLSFWGFLKLEIMLILCYLVQFFM